MVSRARRQFGAKACLPPLRSSGARAIAGAPWRLRLRRAAPKTKLQRSWRRQALYLGGGLLLGRGLGLGGELVGALDLHELATGDGGAERAEEHAVHVALALLGGDELLDGLERRAVALLERDDRGLGEVEVGGAGGLLSGHD